MCQGRFSLSSVILDFSPSMDGIMQNRIERFNAFPVYENEIEPLPTFNTMKSTAIVGNVTDILIFFSVLVTYKNEEYPSKTY